MLKTIDHKTPCSSLIKKEDYLPFHISFPSEETSTPIYWRAGNFESKLIEIGINEKTGSICSIALILPGRVDKNQTKNMATKKSIQGFPVFQISEWPKETFKDEPCEFNVFLKKGSITIEFSREKETNFVYTSHNVEFGFDSNNILIWIDIEIKKEDANIFDKILESQI